jgi:hypothetical protein
MDVLISIIGALTAITVSFIGAAFANRNSIVLQGRKLKEDHYIGYIEALHNLASDNNNVDFTKKYTFARDKMFIIADEKVIIKMIGYEKNVRTEQHDYYLTELIKAIRQDLKIKNKNLPLIHLKK